MVIAGYNSIENMNSGKRYKILLRKNIDSLSKWKAIFTD